VGGLDDVRTYTLRTIGDPNRRLPEDPVRIIRAVKFANLLDLTVDPDLADAMKQHASLIVDCAPARLVEELFKLLRSGAAVECIDQLQEIDVLKELTPTLAIRIASAQDAKTALRGIIRSDEAIRNGRVFSDAVLLSALLYPFCQKAIEASGDVSQHLEAVLMPLVSPLRFTKRHLAMVRQIFIAQPRLTSGKLTGRSRRILKRDYAADAIDLMELVAEKDEVIAFAKMWRKELAKVNPGAKATRQKKRVPQRGRPPARRKSSKRTENPRRSEKR
jgi:poly(A) polymerase